jgi:hypothetical protein
MLESTASPPSKEHVMLTQKPDQLDVAPSNRRNWLVDILAGGLVGGFVGAIAAVNFVIYTGVDQGYEASLFEVFEYSVLAGVVTVLILVAGPVVGVLTARRMRRNRTARAD